MSIWLLTDDVNIDHLIKVVFADFSTVKFGFFKIHNYFIGRYFKDMQMFISISHHGVAH